MVNKSVLPFLKKLIFLLLLVGLLFFSNKVWFIHFIQTFYDIVINFIFQNHDNQYFLFFLSISILFLSIIINLGIVFIARKRNMSIIHRNELNKKTIDDLKDIINNIPVVVLIMDNKGIIMMANNSFYKYSAIGPGDAIGVSIRDIKGIIDFTDDYEMIWQTILTGETWEGETFREISPTSNYWEKTTILPFKDTDGNISNVILLGEDITLRKVAEKEIKESKNIKVKFTSMVSHELRTPLTVIKEIISIVLRGSSGDINDEQRDFLETAKRNIDRLARLVNNVLDFQKLGSGKMPFYVQEHNMNEVILEIYQSMSLLAADKGLEFDLELDDAVPIIKFDRDKVIQVLTNLVNNAIKFTDNGTIKIVSTRGNNVIHVIVKDTGIGMPQEEMSKLFKAFEQLGDPETRPSGGTGLGLVISKEIIVKHRGRIWAESVYGKGSAFHFILPIDIEKY